MGKNAEIWVRIITLERDWGMPREKVLALAEQHCGKDLQAMNVLLKQWQKRGRPPGIDA